MGARKRQQTEAQPIPTGRRSVRERVLAPEEQGGVGPPQLSGAVVLKLRERNPLSVQAEKN